MVADPDDLSVGRMMAEEAGSDCTPYIAGLGLIGGTIALGGLIALCGAFVAWLLSLPLVLRWSYATACEGRARRLMLYGRPQPNNESEGLPDPLPSALRKTGVHTHGGRTYYIRCQFNGCREPMDRDTNWRCLADPQARQARFGSHRRLAAPVAATPQADYYLLITTC